MNERWEAFATLCSALRIGLGTGTAGGLPPDPDWRDVCAVASAHRVLPLLAWSLRRESLPGEVDRLLRAHAARTALTNVQILNALARCGRTLNDAGIVPAALKGAEHLMSGTYPHAGLRHALDIDLLVRPGESDRAQAALLQLGYRRAARALTPTDHHHLPRMTHADDGTSVEIHHGLFDRSVAGMIAPAVCMQQAGTACFRGARLRVLSPDHTLIYNVAHAQLSHGLHREGHVELRQLVDQILLRRRFAERLDWARIARSFAAADRHDVLTDNLRLAQALLGEPLPATAGATARDPVSALRRNIDQPRRRMLRHYARALTDPRRILSLFNPRIWPSRLRWIATTSKRW